MKTTDKYIGLDVHKDTIVIAIADGGRLSVDQKRRSVRTGEIGNT